LSYGEGVAYWALAEMVRGRAEILEAEDASSVAVKLHAAVEQHISDPEERKWVEPRLAHLIGLEKTTSRDKEDLFAAWRLFFERMAEVEPVVMSFEDMQWADASLLDFIEYLLDWSRNHPIFVLTLARPELVDRRPSWGAGRRNFTSIYLEPLSPVAMEQLITGLVPGLPAEVSGQILARAEGVPLYAVETVRMLIDRGLLVREGSSYRPVGAIGALDVPETLHALIAARLDGLSPAERSLLQDAAVVGKSFSKESLAALTGVSAEALDELLASLVRKEVVSLQSDPRSPERGQYGFLQDLVRAVAYEMLPKRDRKDKHLAVAAYLAQGWGADEHEIIEVVASHYLRAYQLAPDAPDAEQVKAKARELNVRAGERAAALAASEEAERYFQQALELSDDASTTAEIAERAGQMARLRGHPDAARAHFEVALAQFDATGRTHASARVNAQLGNLAQQAGQLEGGIERMEQAFEVLSGEDHDEDFATLAAELGRLHFFYGNRELAADRIEVSLEVAERLGLPEQLSQALNTKAMMLFLFNRREEASVLLQHALKVALDNGRHQAALRGYNNLVYSLETRDRYVEAQALMRPAVELARRAGDRAWETDLLSGELSLFISLGYWREAIERMEEIEASEDPLSAASSGVEVLPVAEVYVHRGDLAAARRMVERAAPFADSTDDVQTRGAFACCLSLVLRSEGALEAALAAAEVAVQSGDKLGSGSPTFKFGTVAAIEAALELGEVARADHLLQMIERLAPGEVSPALRAHGLRLRARLSADDGDDGDDADDADTAERFSAAAAIFRELSTPFWLAVTLLEHASWLAANDRAVEAEPLFGEARDIFERLEARPFLDRIAGAENRETISA
jgi:tetratricopeptide (TPR) repeat protein